MPRYKAMMAADMAHPIEKVGRELRARMSWLKSDKQAAA
jgi:ketol-acid reductoisomerase